TLSPYHTPTSPRYNDHEHDDDDDDDDGSYDNLVQNNELTASAIDGGGKEVDVRSDVFMETAKISKHKFERAKARQWATRDICFLVYDDSDVKIGGFDSDEEALQKHALRMSLGDNDTLIPEGDEAQRSEYADDSWKAKCCKPRKFRLVNPTVDHLVWFGKGADLNIASIHICLHYVAPPRDDNPIPRSYTARDLDGRVRTSRALDDVLDRAVDFANSCGLRIIWIDQECLLQPAKTITNEG
ncbi:hypothetical protein GGP41_006002, partial [Bipolaris sorokiniana]